jgi:dethiobiotin synthetase
MTVRSRPGRLVVVTGTGTEVGKTWVSAAVLRLARAQGLSVAARKPAQSFAPDQGPDQRDAYLLAAATGEPADVVCRPERSYPVPMAPPMAAEALGRDLPDLAGLVAEIGASWPGEGGCDLGLVEGAGGVASPITIDGDCADLAHALSPDIVVLVGDPSLGVINSGRLCVRALHPLPVVVHLNRFEPENDLHRRNRDWLVGHDAMRVTTSAGALLGEVIGRHP